MEPTTGEESNKSQRRRVLAWLAVLQIGADRIYEERARPITDGFAIKPGGRIVKGYVQNLWIIKPYLMLSRLRIQAKLEHRRAAAGDIHHPQIAAKFIVPGDHDALLFAVNADD